MSDRVERMSPELRGDDVLAALGNSELTVTEIFALLKDIPGWRSEDGSGYAHADAKRSLVYVTVERLRFQGHLTRQPTGRGSPRWRYMKVERPLHGEIARIAAQFT